MALPQLADPRESDIAQRLGLGGERLEAALTDDHNVLVLAGPGAGKTFLLVAHAAHLAETSTSGQKLPWVAMDAEGDFVVVWNSTGSVGNDNGSVGVLGSTSIQGKRFNSSGSPQSGQFQVNTYTPKNQYKPAVAMAANGDFVVVWNSYGSAGSDSAYLHGYSVQGQRYSASGSPRGSQFQINSYTESDQQRVAVALADDGDYVAAWMSLGSNGNDTSVHSIQGRLYATPEVFMDGFETGGTSSWSSSVP